MDNKELKELLEAEAEKIEDKDNKNVLKSPEHRKAEQEIDDWKKETKEYSPIEQFRIPHELINVLLTTKQFNGIIFYGEGGIGKTVLTISSIKHSMKPDQWEYSNGYTTPLALYEFLYYNRDKKVIILDDVEGIFNNSLSLSILKGALWDSDGKRICQYSSKSEKAKMPEKFIMKAKIIILCNQIPKEHDASTRAMISRTIPYEIKFTFRQKMDICDKFINQDTSLDIETRKDVMEILKSYVTPATKDFNFRTLKKLIAFVQYDKRKAVNLFRATTEADENKEAYFYAVSRTDNIKAQISIFQEMTGKSRRTFFTVKKSISAEVK